MGRRRTIPITLTVTFPSFRLRQRPSADAFDIPGRRGRETLRFPLSVPARLAVIDVAFHAGPNTKIFEPGDFSGLRNYAPDALALPASTVLAFAERKLRGHLDLPSLKLAIVVLSSLDSPVDLPLASPDRDLLWIAFGLPLFEQLCGWDGRVVARECEVHDGLHLDSATERAEVHAGRLMVDGRPTGLSAEIVKDQCECGIETPRLCHLAALRQRASSARSAA